jgi:proline dehydrogenase
MRSLLAPIAMPILRMATRSYVTGPKVLDAMGVANSAAQRGLGSTICYWNDGTEDPQEVLGQYLASLAAIHEAHIDADLAVKIPALWDRRELVERIVGRAREVGRRVVFDSHAPAQSDLTFELLSQLGPEGLGCAIPGCWRRSLQDVERAIELGVRVRVVKGQWPDPQQPDMDLRAGFLAVIDALAGRATSVGIATHDVPLAREAMRRLASAGTPCELELLFPMPIEEAVREARAAGIAVRLYIPFGEAWLPYSVSRALRNPRVLGWLLRDLVLGRDFKLPKTAD